jgi:hypothetical protein
MFCVDIRQDCAIIRFRKMKRIFFSALIIRQLRRRQKQKYAKNHEKRHFRDNDYSKIGPANARVADFELIRVKRSLHG